MHTSYRFLLRGARRMGISLVALVGIMLPSSAQPPELQNVISSTSPGSASLAKYIDFPVSLTNGVPEINISLYDLKSSKLSVPISLSYHAAGVKVTERTSTMGLGWTLNAGGAITRVVKGLPDDSQYGFLNMTWPVIDTTTASRNAQYCLANQIYNIYTANGTEGIYDGEPDIYFYNANTIGGKFVWRNVADASGQRAVTIPFAPIKIVYNQGTIPFAITGQDGTTYQFGDPAAGASTEYYYDQNAAPEVRTVNTAWQLTKIISADKTDTVYFKYTSTQDLYGLNDTRTSAAAHFSAYSGVTNPIGVPVTISTVSYSRQEYSARLTEIDTRSGKAILNYGNASPFTPLTSIEIYAMTKGTYEKIKTFSLGISNFTNTYPASNLNTLRLDSVAESGFRDGTTYTMPPYQFTYSTADAPPFNSKGQDLWGYYNGQPNTDLLMISTDANSVTQYAPQKRAANPTYMGKAMLQRVTYPTKGFTDFTFEPNQMVAPVQVTIPGQTTSQSISTLNMGVGTGSNGIDVTFYPISDGTGTAQITFSGTFMCSVSSSCVGNTPEVRLVDVTLNQVLIDKTLTQLQSGTLTTENYSQTLTGIDKTHQYRLYFPSPGTITSNSQNTQYRLNATFSEKAPDQIQVQQQTVYGGGLRVKRITANDGNNNTIIKDYNYTKPYFTTNAFQGDFFYLFYNCFTQAKQLPSSNINPSLPNSPPASYFISSFYYLESPSFSVGGSFNSAIAYQEVEEIHSAADGTNIGKTVYTYNQALDYLMNWPMAFRIDRDAIRGQLLDTKVYKNLNGSYVLIRDVANTYTDINNYEGDAAGQDSIQFFIAQSFYDCAQRVPFVSGGGDPGAPGCTQYPSNFGEFTLTPMYYHVGKNLLTSTVSTEYDPSNPTPLVTTTNYTYGNYAHMQPTVISTTTSDQQLRTKLITYPLDYTISGTASNTIAQGIQNLQYSHIITPAIEEIVQKSNTDGSNVRTLSSIFTTFKTTSPYPDLIYATENSRTMNSFSRAMVSASSSTIDSHYQPKVAFDSYDGFGNLLQQHKINDQNHAYVWDYNNLYPIAEVINAQVADVAYTSFESDGVGNWNIGSSVRDTVESITGSRCYSANSDISKSSLISSKTYIVSYWTKQSSPFTINGTISGYPIKGKTVNGWTLYVHKVTEQTTISLSGSGLIDELRLYPAEAQMKTYTYAPLIGMTSACDIGNRITYYEYDGLQRLKRIRDQDYNIIKSIDYQYQGTTGCGTNCYIMTMQTLAGTNTLGYPVGVFNIHEKLLGNAKDSSEYFALWNSDTADNRIGTLSAGGDAMHFNMTLNSGQTLPGGVTGCRYYQVDLTWNQFDGVRNFNGCYVDFGDGTGMRLGANLPDTLHDLAPNTVQVGTAAPWFNRYALYLIHSYPDTSLKTLTFYHNDGQETENFDNANSPATSLPHVSHLRGNLPRNMTEFGGSSYQQASMLSVDSIANWNTIHSINNFHLNTGDGGVTNILHVHYAQDFMAGNLDLDTIQLSRFTLECYFDSTFKISTLKSDWNTYFKHLKWISISDRNWDREDLTPLTELNYVAIGASRQYPSNDPTNNPYIPIPRSVVDSIFIQIAAGAGQHVSNGTLGIQSGGSGHSAASSAAIAALLAKGWLLGLDGQFLTSPNDLLH